MRQILSILILSVLFFHLDAQAGSISSVEILDVSTEKITVTLAGEALEEEDFSVFEIPGEDPRIVIDISDSSSELLKNGNFERDFDTVDQIRGALRDTNHLRFVIDLKAGQALDAHSLKDNQFNVYVSGAFIRDSGTPDPDAPIPRIKPEPPQKPVIVIDAGHGGKDPGALGGTGLKEKSVTLKAALKLEKQLNATGLYDVVLSRQDDRYLEHEDRLKLARTKNADLFISIHADATKGKTARGASVYTLADRSKARSKNVVKSQNWIMDVNLTEQSEPVGDILVDLAQRNTLSQSSEFADILIEELAGSTHLLRNTHRRAGYYVLLAPDVPAVLLELGFISNSQDEKLLKSDKHIEKLMSSVTTAINLYFDRQKS